MNSCKWESGKFYPCEGFDPSSESGTAGKIGKPFYRIYCKSCGADISKPKSSEPVLTHLEATE